VADEEDMVFRLIWVGKKEAGGLAENRRCRVDSPMEGGRRVEAGLGDEEGDLRAG